MYSATILVDASWCEETKVAGYGYWIASDRGKVGGGDKLKGPVESCNLAEMQAICSTLFIVQQIQFVLPRERVLVRTDSEAAILAFKKKRNLSKNEQSTVEIYDMLAHGIEISFRHIKGHTGSKEKASIGNQICDQTARKYMKLARKEFNEISTRRAKT